MELLRFITLLATIVCTVGGSSTPEEFEALYIDLETCDYNSDMCNTPAFYDTLDARLLELHKNKCVFEDYSDGTSGRYVACHPRRKTAAWYRDRCENHVQYNKSCSEELHKREFCRYSEVCLSRFSPPAPSCITQTTISDGDVLCGHNSSWEDNSSSASSLDSVLGHNPTSTIIILTALCSVLLCSLVLNGVLIYLRIRNSRSTKNNDPEKIQENSENEAAKGLLGNTKEKPGIRRQKSHSSHPDDATDDEKEKTANSSEQLNDTGL